MRVYPTVDEAAKASINGIIKKSRRERHEYEGMIYSTPGGYRPAPPVRTSAPLGGGRKIPGRMYPSRAGGYHTHPYNPGEWVWNGVQSGWSQSGPSGPDKRQANSLGVPEYVGEPNGAIYRYDPKTGTIKKVQ